MLSFLKNIMRKMKGKNKDIQKCEEITFLDIFNFVEDIQKSRYNNSQPFDPINPNNKNLNDWIFDYSRLSKILRIQRIINSEKVNIVEIIFLPNDEIIKLTKKVSSNVRITIAFSINSKISDITNYKDYEKLIYDKDQIDEFINMFNTILTNPKN